jgi:hypothetical protein
MAKALETALMLVIGGAQWTSPFQGWVLQTSGAHQSQVALSPLGWSGRGRLFVRERIYRDMA